MQGRTFDELAALDDVGVGVVDRHVEAEGLQQDVLVADQLLGLRGCWCLVSLLSTCFTAPHSALHCSAMLKSALTSVRYCSDLESN